MLDRAEKLARSLPAAPGEKVGLLCRNSARMIEALIGVTTLGADPVLMNTGLSPHQLATVAKDQGLRALIFDDEFAAKVTLVEGVEKIGEQRFAELISGAPPQSGTVPP